MYATKTDNFNSTKFDKVMFHVFGDGVFTEITSLINAVLAALDPSYMYPTATSILVGTFATHAMIWQAFRFGDYYYGYSVVSRVQKGEEEESQKK